MLLILLLFLFLLVCIALMLLAANSKDSWFFGIDEYGNGSNQLVPVYFFILFLITLVTIGVGIYGK